MKARAALFLFTFSLLWTGLRAPAWSEEPAAGPNPPAKQENSWGNCTKRGKDWLKENQNADGSWGEQNKAAMTGLALLAFLSHGETPESEDYGKSVASAVTWILENGAKSDGRLCMAKEFSQTGVYEHGICTYALGEYYLLTEDERVAPLLKKAVGYIVEGQGPGGGWMYSYDKSANDLCVSSWQIQALDSAKLGKLEVPGVDEALQKAMKYLESVKGPNGGYGYRMAEDRYSLTGAAIFCHLLGGAKREDLRQGAAWLLEETEKKKPVKYQGENADLYAWFYHTRAFMLFGGPAWTKWNRWYQDEILNAQSPDGSWPVPGRKGYGPQGDPGKNGQVYRTSLCLLMLDFWNPRWRRMLLQK